MTRARWFPGLWIALALGLAAAPAGLSAQQRGRSAPAETAMTPQALGIHGFSVVLVVGGMQGADSGDTVPAAARKALTDMRDFLPYKRYQLLDAAWMLCCSGFGRNAPSISGRLRGPEQREYTYHIDPIGVGDGRINLRFSMREVASPELAIDPAKMSDTAKLEHGRLTAEALRERDEAQQALRRAEQQYQVGLLNRTDVESARLRLQRAEARARDLRAIAVVGGRPATRGGSIMDSTFAIAPGETVVIGTSRLMGDQALIALLTAATKPGGGTR
jgi:hypothetical protein